MTTLGTALIRVMPSMSGFTPALRQGVTGQIAAAGAGLSRAVSIPIIAGFAGSLNAATKFESGLAGVAKTTDLSGAALRRMGESVVSMANRMPFTRENILGVVEAAGRFGVSEKNLLSFSETALQLGTATNLGAEQAATQLTRLANIVKLPEDQFKNLGSTIVALGNDFPTTEEEIARFSQRLAQVSTVSTASAADILGMSAGMASLGIRSEMGGTAMSRIFYTINDAVQSGGERLIKFADIAGMSTDAFKSLYQTDSTAAVERFISGINRLNQEGANTPGILRQIGLGEIRVRDTVLRAAGGYETFSRAIRTARDAFGENIALEDEYNKRLKTTAAQWDILKNRITNIGLQFGQGLLPVANSLMGPLGGVADTIADIGQAFAGLPSGVKTATASFLALVAAIGPMMWMGAVVKSSLTQIAGGMGALAAQLAGFSAAQAGSGVPGLLGAAGGAAARIPLAIGGAMVADAINQIRNRESITGMAGRGKLGQDTLASGETHQEDWSWSNVKNALLGRADIDASIDPNIRQRQPSQALMDLMTAKPMDLSMSPHRVPARTAGSMDDTRASLERLNAANILYTRTITEADVKEMERVNRLADARRSFDDLRQSTQWTNAEFAGGMAGMSAYNQQFFALAGIAMNTETAYDALGESLKKNKMNFDLSTEAGRENQSAVMGLAQALESQFVSAYDDANGSQTRFMQNARNIGSGVMATLQEELGLSAEQAAELAAKLGLTEGDYEARWKMSGLEEAKVRLDLMAASIGLLDEKTRREIALKIGTGDFIGALEIANEALAWTQRTGNEPIRLKGDASAIGRVAIDAKDIIERNVPTSRTTSFNANNPGRPVMIDAKDVIESVPRSRVTVMQATNPGRATAVDAKDRIEAIPRGRVSVIQATNPGRSTAIDAKDRIEAIPRSRNSTITATDNATRTVNSIKAAIDAIRGKTVSVNVVTNRIEGTVTTAPRRSSEGRFVPGGSWMYSTLGEDPGRTGDEVILPLGKPARLRELVSDPRVSERLMAAMGISGGGGGGTLPGGGAGAPGIGQLTVYLGTRQIEDIIGVEIDGRRMADMAGRRY
jgi:TP901 family phage tail tape measure protein